jgi:NADH dehydrogenase
MDKVLLLGGSGFVGRSLAQRLIERHPGVTVVVPTRRLAHTQAIRHLPGVEPVQADVHDAGSLARLARGCDAAVNLVAILHGSAAEFERVHARLPATLAAALRAAAVARLVHVSALGASRDAPSSYLRSKAAGEDALRSAGLALTLLRPSVIFGAHDRFLNLFAGLQALAPIMPLAQRDARFQPVWVEDVAGAIVRALEQPAAIGQVYECTGPQVYTLGELVRLAGRWSGHERAQIGLPHWAGQLQALALEWLPGVPLMSRDNLASMRVPSVSSGTLPGLRELGIEPAALEAVAPGYLAPGQGVARLDRWRASRG